MLGPIQLLKSSWQLYIANFNLFLGMGLFGQLLSALVEILWLPALPLFTEKYIGDQFNQVNFARLGFGLLFLVFAVVGLLVIEAIRAIALIIAIDRVCRHQSIGVLESFRSGLSRLWVYLWTNILVGLMTIIGLILLVVPGIYLWISFSFVSYLIILENQKGVQAIKLSREMVKGYWWKIFVRILFSICLLLILSASQYLVWFVLSFTDQVLIDFAIELLFAIVFLPIFIAYGYFLYQETKKLQLSNHVISRLP
ncbi:hypothetical protein HY388_01355 [Candidatus Daviesbacteria bacterium]|nr:hypothetical protein [Candidatus Daviesbacteria bacterium]